MAGRLMYLARLGSVPRERRLALLDERLRRLAVVVRLAGEAHVQRLLVERRHQVAGLARG